MQEVFPMLPAFYIYITLPMNYKAILSILVLAVCVNTACHSPKQADKSAIDASAWSATTTVPYMVANNYFVSNTVSRLPQAAFTTQADFDACFGAAATMGAGGQPTSIDFSKQFVIAVDAPATRFSTEIMPVSLDRNESGQLVFSYKKVVGEEQTYTMHPCLVIVVSKEQGTSVILHEVK